MGRWTVREQCEQRNITVEELAERAVLDVQRVEAIVAGRWTPSPEERKRIAAALELNVEDLAWGHQITPKPFYGHGPA